MAVSDRAGERVVGGMAFMVGRWRGEGAWGGRPFTSDVMTTRLVGRFLQIDVTASRAGDPPHREVIVVHAEGDAAVATVYPDRGEVQRFAVLEQEPGVRYRLVFTPPAGSGLTAQRWTIERDDAGYHERFEVAVDGAHFTESVACAYRPVSEPA